MTLRKQCVHERWEEHWTYPCPHHQGHHMNLEAFHQCQEMNKRSCPGGEFLPEGALVVEKKAGGRHKSLTVEAVENVLLSQYDYEIREAMLSVVQPLAIAVLAALDALASQVGESG